jgi:putative ABC transport system permease protein
MITDYFALAFKNLRHRGIRSWLTLLGIFIGVTAVISLISLSGGLKAAVVSQFGVSNMEVITIQAGGINSVGPPGTGVTEPLIKGDAEAIERLSSIEIAFGRIISSGKVEFNNQINFVYLASIPVGNNRKIVYEIIDLEIEQGRALRDGDTNKVILGHNFYTNKQKFEKIISPGDKILIQDKKFEVVGIAKKKGSFVLDNAIFMNEDSMRDLLDYGNKVDIILAKVKSKDVMERAKEEIERLMRQRRDVKLGKENFEVSTPDAILKSVNQILGGVQVFIIIIASISIIVGAIGIANTMTTSVLERKKEIGIMKAVGAKNSQIFFQFFVESGLLGLVGGIIGILLGLTIGYIGVVGINSFLGSEITLDINLFLILGTLSGSFIIGSVSGIVPAMNAAKQNPVEALRE